jgi:hypothetical protein
MPANLSSDAVPFRWILLVVSWAVAAVGIGAVVQDRLDDGGAAGDQVIEVPASDAGDVATDGTVPPGAGSATDDPVLRAADQMRITGTVTVVGLGATRLEPSVVATPLTLLSEERGFNNGGELTGVTVSDRDSTIVWDGGRPFVVSSGPGLAVGAGDVELVPEGLRYTLGPGAHVFERGSYRLNTPVAVGSTGIATARDSVTFVAGPEARFAPTGHVSVVLGPTGPHRLIGAGFVRLEGELQIEDATGRRAVTELELAQVRSDLVFTPSPTGGWTVSGTVDADADADAD